ncbi:hypothetical protein [Glycomyces terrestris]|uniref:Uncharacterized protein n=1 Tax=Glycomyces terrestris TaxID=2493553 RepID=A0A426V3N9_9ACTN|nr:hypothetical protein [Glycomyces terrestris]RRS01486.1 hypothetical protein EIW28_01565 [Glycomyces terrestris]
MRTAHPPLQPTHAIEVGYGFTASLRYCGLMLLAAPLVVPLVVFTDAPPGALILIVPAVCFPAVTFILMRSGAVKLVSVRDGRLRVSPSGWVERRIGTRRHQLAPGDALVATDDDLYLWHHRHQAYEALGVNVAWADPEDWARLRAWSAANWPVAPPH